MNSHGTCLLAHGDSVERGCLEVGHQCFPDDLSKSRVCNGDVGKGPILAQVLLVKSRKDLGSDDLIHGL